MASNEEVDDDDFYSAANWADVADPDVLGFDEPVSTPQQAQETARVPSPRAQRHRSRSPVVSRRSPQVRQESPSRRSRSPPPRLAEGRSSGGSGGSMRGGPNYRQRSRSRSRSAEHAAKRSRWGSAGSERHFQGSHRDSRGQDSERRSRDRGADRRFRDNESRNRNQSAPPARSVPLEVFKVYPGVVQRVQEYGCFVRLEGVEKCRDGLAHASTYVGGEAPSAGVKLWCKVLSVSHDSGQQRIALSLNLVDQRTGEDLDPLHREAEKMATSKTSGGGGALSDALPELYSIHKGVVAKVESFGCFVSLAGFRKNGLVHVSQLADFKVESTADFVNVGDEVWTKVISHGSSEEPNEPPKLSLSMKYCAQGDGRDLDPGHGMASADAQKKGPGPKGRKPIVVGDSLDPMAQFARSSAASGAPGEDATYDFVGSDDERTAQAQAGKTPAAAVSAAQAAEDRKYQPAPAFDSSTQQAGLAAQMTEDALLEALRKANGSEKSRSKKAAKREKKEKKGKKGSKKDHKKDAKKKFSKRESKKEAKRKKAKKASSTSESSSDGSSSDSGELSELEWGKIP